MKKHNACVCTERGWVEISAQRVINYCTRPTQVKVLRSPFYKQKMGEFWPHVKLLTPMPKATFEHPTHKPCAAFETTYIPHVSRYPEWTPQQLKEALCHLVRISQYSAKHGYQCRTHLWNVTFYRGKPLLIDIRDFQRRRCSKSDTLNVILGAFRDKTDNHCPILMSRWFVNWQEVKKVLQGYIQDATITVDQALTQALATLQTLASTNTGRQLWAGYHKFGPVPLALLRIVSLYGAKSRSICTILDRLKAKSTVELGCNNGLYCFYASQYGPCVGIDYAPTPIEQAHRLTAKRNYACQFVQLDLLNPAKAYGLRGGYGTAVERFCSELMLAPALLHHLYKQCRSVERMLDAVMPYAKTYALLEFIPCGYTLVNLKASLARRSWQVIEQLPSKPAERCFVLCKKS